MRGLTITLPTCVRRVCQIKYDCSQNKISLETEYYIQDQRLKKINNIDHLTT